MLSELKMISVELLFLEGFAYLSLVVLIVIAVRIWRKL